MEKEVVELKRAVEQAIKALKLDQVDADITTLEQAMAKPGLWNDRETATAKAQELARLQGKVAPWRALEKRVQELFDLLQLGDSSLLPELSSQLAQARADYAELELQLKLAGPYDDHNAILSIHAGTGGTDAMDWAAMLERMYLRYGEKTGLKTEVLEEQPGDEAGLKRATLRLEGTYAYGRLKGEHGVHRLIRLSPFNADSLRQTSFALVEVLPEIATPQEIELDEKDLKVDVFRAGGHGGQSVNTTDSAVRITHLPTGITIAIQNERSQLQNKQTALKILSSKLAQLAIEQHQEKVSELKGPDTQAAWGNQIRNYVLHPYTLVKDTRTGYETHNASAVLDGELDSFVDSYLKSQIS